MRGVAALAVAGAALLLAASGSPRGIKEGGTFKVGVTASFIRTIDPALVGLPFELSVLWPACEILVAYPAKPPPAGLQLEPELAEAMLVVSQDGKTYTFTIRKDARFSTGAPVTAQAILREIERAIDPALGDNTDLASLIVGGEDVLAGKATTPSGAIARGRTLTVKLTRREPTFLSQYVTALCAVPPKLPADAEGAKAPLASPAPYYVSEYVPGQRIVLSRNPYYKGPRPHHVDRFTVNLALDEGSIVDEIASGKLDWGGVTADTWAARSKELAQRYGVNESQFFVKPGLFLRMFL